MHAALPRVNHRIGQIVPSSNTTREPEIPALLRACEAALSERFTFHSSRMLKALSLQAVAPDAGALLSGRF